MKKTFGILIFILFVALGLFMGKNLGTQNTPIALNHSNLQPNRTFNNQSPTAVPWQENFVVVVVDQITAEAIVDSVWYLKIDKEINTRTMIALYPQKTDDDLAEEPVVINAQEVKSALNLPVITSKRLQIDHILIVDEVFANAVVALGDPIVLAEVPYDSFTDVIDIAKPWEKPSRSLDNQIAVLINICGNSLETEAQNLFQVDSIKNHVVTTTSLSDLNARWNEMILTTTGDYCEILIGS